MSYTRKQFKSELDWLGGRIIGGSGASAIVGENPYKTNVQYFNNMMKIKKGYQVRTRSATKKQLCLERKPKVLLDISTH